MANHKFGFGTLCLHAGQIPDPTTGARAASTFMNIRNRRERTLWWRWMGTPPWMRSFEYASA